MNIYLQLKAHTTNYFGGRIIGSRDLVCMCGYEPSIAELVQTCTSCSHITDNSIPVMFCQHQDEIRQDNNGTYNTIQLESRTQSKIQQLAQDDWQRKMTPETRSHDLHNKMDLFPHESPRQPSPALLFLRLLF